MKTPEQQDFRSDPRFQGLRPFENRVWLAAPAMHGGEQAWVEEAFRTNWVSTVGANIDEAERLTAGMTGRKYAVALSSGTAALHLSVRLCGEKLYGRPRAGHGALAGRRVFCSDMTFGATVNPVAYEGGEAVFIDTEPDTWNMDPAALERAFEADPDVRLVVLVHLYGVPAKMEELLAVCQRHHALVVEDAAESLGAAYDGRQTGSFGAASVVSYNGNKIITGSSGGMFLTDDADDAARIRKWSTQSREAAPWYQHEELGYNYRMSNLVAGVIRGQFPHLEAHIARKRAIYERYRAGLRDLPVQMNPYDAARSLPNCWLSCLILDEEAMCPQVRGDTDALYRTEPGKSCPTEILEALAAFNAEGRPIWKPMHLQPVYRAHRFFPALRDGVPMDQGADIFRRGLCLPSDIGMTEAQQDAVIELIHRCFL